MKTISAAFLLLLMITFSGCEIIGTIFKGGMWFGIIIVVAIVGLIVFLFNRNKK